MDMYFTVFCFFLLATLACVLCPEVKMGLEVDNQRRVGFLTKNKNKTEINHTYYCKPLQRFKMKQNKFSNIFSFGLVSTILSNMLNSGTVCI